VSAEIKGRPAVTVPHGRGRSLAVLWGDKPAPGDATITVRRWVPLRGARGPVMGSWAQTEKVRARGVAPVDDHPRLTDARMSLGWS